MKLKFSWGKHSRLKNIWVNIFINCQVKSDNEDNIKQGKCIEYRESYKVIRESIIEKMAVKHKLNEMNL